jgi:hypothetical protein
LGWRDSRSTLGRRQRNFTHAGYVCRLQGRMDASSLKAAPPLDAKNVRDALLRVLRARGLEPQASWVAVRVADAPFSPERTYAVVIAYQPARAALSSVLRRRTSVAEKYAVGVWMLDESEARELCDGDSNLARWGVRTATARPLRVPRCVSRLRTIRRGR